MSNCCYNPIVYCWMNDKFRTGFRYMFRWCPCVRRPDVLPDGRSMMYAGAMSMSPAGMTHSTGSGGRVRWASATVVRFNVTGAGSPRVRTNVLAVQASSSTESLGSSGDLRRSPLTTRDHQRRQGQRGQVDTVAESYQLKPTQRAA